MAVQVSKALVYAVTVPKTPAVDLSKALAYAVTWAGYPGVSVGKALAYAVIVSSEAPTARPTQTIVT